MLVLNKRCTVCKVVKINKQLLKRIYESSWYVPHSTDSLKQISRDTGLGYQAIKIHTKKHQFIDSQDYTEKMLSYTDKRMERNAVQKAVKAVDAVQSIIEKGNKRLEDGEITVDTNQLLRASQIKMTHESRQKDQELATIEMVAHFLSGENASDRVYISPEAQIPTSHIVAED